MRAASSLVQPILASSRTDSSQISFSGRPPRKLDFAGVGFFLRGFFLRGGEERAPIADELSRNHLDQALGSAGISDRKEGRRKERLKLQGLGSTPLIGEYPVLVFPIKPKFKRDIQQIADDEQRNLSQICEMLLYEGVAAYK